MKEWKWFGHAAHFIGASSCRFHLATLLPSGYIVSTVGDYRPALPEQFRRNPDGPEPIGINRTYETMVFKAGEPCTDPECNCGLPEIDPMEIDFGGYSNAGDATRGHFELCTKWEAPQ